MFAEFAYGFFICFTIQSIVFENANFISSTHTHIRYVQYIAHCCLKWPMQINVFYVKIRWKEKTAAKSMVNDMLKRNAHRKIGETKSNNNIQSMSIGNKRYLDHRENVLLRCFDCNVCLTFYMPAFRFDYYCWFLYFIILYTIWCLRFIFFFMYFSSFFHLLCIKIWLFLLFSACCCIVNWVYTILCISRLKLFGVCKIK